MRKEKGEIFIFLLNRRIVESQNRGILRVSECRSKAVTELVEFCE